MRVLRFILDHSSPYRKYIAGILIAICLVAVVEMTLPVFIKQLMDMPRENIFSNLWSAFLWYGLLQLIRCIAWVLCDSCEIPLLSHFRLNIASSFTKKLYNYSYTFFQNKLSGQLSAKVNDTVVYTPLLIFKFILEFVYIFLVITVSLIILYMVQPGFAGFMMVWTCLFIGINLICRKKIIFLSKNYSEERAKFLGFVGDYISNIFTAKLFVTKDFESQNIQEKNELLIESTYKKYRYLMVFYFVQGIIASVYSLGFIMFSAKLYQTNLITPGDFTLVVTTNLTLVNKLFQFSHALRDFLEEYGSVEQALNVFDYPPEIQDSPEANPLKITNGKIVFENINFNYQNHPPLFHKISFHIEPGQKIGLVGYSGGGKSTLINLLLRFYDVKEGRITIDDQDIRQVTQDSLRQQIGLIPQNPCLFHRTIAENIAYGRIGATEADIRQASIQAGAHSFIEKLSYQYNSMVGERGLKLSGGQIQRLAIARIFLKDPPVVILDEATSQLDSLTENDIQEKLWTLMCGKTVIVIAHRLSTLLKMDRILVLSKGKIVQDGPHKQLICQEGLYKTLWEAQADGFVPRT